MSPPGDAGRAQPGGYWNLAASRCLAVRWAGASIQMNAIVCVIFAILLFLGPVNGVLALDAEVPPPATGIPIRAWPSGAFGHWPYTERRLEGRLQKLTSDSLVLLERSGARRALPMRALDHIEVVDAGHPTKATGAGALLGVAGGLLIGAYIGDTITTPAAAGGDVGHEPYHHASMGAFFGGCVGLLIGAEVGSHMMRPHWVDVTEPWLREVAQYPVAPDGPRSGSQPE